MTTDLSGQSVIIDSTFTIEYATSKDGTKIGYKKYKGNGTALLLIQGAVGTTIDYHELAIALSKTFTVYVPERRGRFLSPKEFTINHSIERDVEDVSCVADSAGAEYLFGLSSGALIVLESAKNLTSIRKVVIYEPPFYNPLPKDELNITIKTISENRLSDGLAHAFKIVRVGPKIMNILPLGILKIMTKMFLKYEEKQKEGRYPKFETMIPSMRYDFTDVLARGGKLESYKVVNKPVLLLGGSKSPGFLIEALDSLEKILPNQKRIIFKKLDHSAPWNSDRGGSPGKVSQAIIDFLK